MKNNGNQNSSIARTRGNDPYTTTLEMEEIDDGIWNIVYYNTVVGRLNRKTGKITGHDKV
jgi:hypothetical protein